MIETQSTDIILTANVFRLKVELKTDGMVNIGFGPSISQNSDKSIKSLSNVDPINAWDPIPSSTRAEINDFIVGASLDPVVAIMLLFKNQPLS